MKIRITAIALLCLTLNGFAQWNNDPNVNTPVCTTPGSMRIHPKPAPDGLGGVFVAWAEIDASGTTASIFAQHLSASGNRLWAAAGINVSGTGGVHSEPRVVPDGKGGAIISWTSTANLQLKHYVQRISASGQIQWNPGGILVCDLTDALPLDYKLISDNQNGAIIIWDDFRTNSQIYAQRIDNDGNLLWPAAGLPVSNEFSDYLSVDAVADSTGGFIFCYSMNTNLLYHHEIFAQHINANGVATWGATGLDVSHAHRDQLHPSITKDSLDNVIIVWQDFRPDPFYSQLFGQRININGEFQWGDTAKRLVDHIVPATAFQHVVTDTSRGAVIGWLDGYVPTQTTTADIFALRVDSMGNKIYDKTELASDIPMPQFFQFMPDYAGGSFAFWSAPGSGTDLFMQHITKTGTVDFPLLGKAVTTAPSEQVYHQMITDSSGFAYFAWTDVRSGVQYEIYAARSGATSSTLPVTWVNFTGGWQQNDVLLKWQTGIEINNKGFTVQRSNDGKKFSDIGFVDALGIGGKYSFLDDLPMDGDNYYRLQQEDLDGKTELSSTIRISAEKDVSLKIYPNPASQKIFARGLALNSSIIIYDVNGRKLKEVRNGAASSIDIDISALPAGIFYITVIGKGKQIWQNLVKPAY